MDYQQVRDAYSLMAGPYIDLFDGDWKAHQRDTAFVERHLTGVSGVPDFIAHARATHPGPDFQLCSMTELDVPDHSVAGILAWYSTIHLAPPELDRMLVRFRRLLAPSGMLVAGFFDSDDDVAEFDHTVVTAYRWPAEAFAERLVAAGFAEVERLQQRFPERPDRAYAAIAARVSDEVSPGLPRGRTSWTASGTGGSRVTALHRRPGCPPGWEASED